MKVNSNNNIILVGPMGSGKTTVGRKLSQRLEKDFFDSDHEIIARTGVSIDHIFEIEGEKGFRQRETDVLKDLCSMTNIVISTGGGAVLSSQNRDLFKISPHIVYLSSSIDQILRRTSKSKTRPILEKSTNRRKTISDIVEAREPFYKELASLIINTNGKKLNEVIDEIESKL
tara:strand:- start:208 stop:726 length:519 start_codon:yes stop_codon:yes gene_type:complete